MSFDFFTDSATKQTKSFSSKRYGRVALRKFSLKPIFRKIAAVFTGVTIYIVRQAILIIKNPKRIINLLNLTRIWFIGVLKAIAGWLRKFRREPKRAIIELYKPVTLRKSIAWCLVIFLFLNQFIYPFIPQIRLGQQGFGKYEILPENERATLYQSKTDINLKQNNNLKNGGFKWSVTLPTGTIYSFARQTEEGLTPVIRVTNKTGYFIEYDLPKAKIISPKVKKNTIQWEIANGIVAKYTMEEDKVKADYIVDSFKSLNALPNGRLAFEIMYGGKDKVSNEEFSHQVMPNGDIAWLDKDGQEVFSIPPPIVIEAGAKDQELTKWEGSYSIKNQEDGRALLAIILPIDKLKQAKYPITIDPVTLDSVANTAATGYGNERKILRDPYGNLIVLCDCGNGDDNVYSKDHNGTAWTDEAINLGSDVAQDPEIAADLDSALNVHVSYRPANSDNTGYVKLTVTRAADNTITSISLGTRFDVDTGVGNNRSTLIVANKGEGSGKEKVVIAWAMDTTTGGTARGEIRTLQCDVADDCTAAANWKNASEEKNASGTCSDVLTSGNAGIPNAATCKGASDRFLEYEVAHTVHIATLSQIPGKVRRSPTRAVKDIGGVLTNLTNAINNSAATTETLNSLTTTDYVYVGDANVFSKVSTDITDTNTGVATFTTRQYCSANSDTSTTCDTWSTLSNYIDNTATATISWSEDGSILFDQPSDWVKSVENSGSQAYFVRLRPSAAFDSTVSVDEFYVNDRNSKALLVVGGNEDLDDLGSAYIPWDDIGQASWENNPATAGTGWRVNIIALDTLGGDWNIFTSFPLSATVDYINNTVYVSYVENQATDVLHVKYARNNVDLSIATNWIDTAFPTVTEGLDVAVSLTSDGSDIYLFYVLDPDASGLVYRKCTPNGGGNANICDAAGDWGSETTFVAFVSTTIEPNYPQPVVSKASGDTVAIDVAYTNQLATVALVYERHYVNLADKTVPTAATTDTAFHRDCISGTDDGFTGATSEPAVGRDPAQVNCVGSVDAELHAGMRFPAVNVVQGATISSAYLDFRVSQRSGSTAVDFTAYGEDADNSSAFAQQVDCADPCAGLVNSRTKTTSSSSMSINTTTNIYRLDVTNLVQEIVCRGASNSQPCVGNFNGAGTWASGNALALLLISTEGGAVANLFTINNTTADPNDTLKPTLHINCETTCGTTASAATWCSIDGTPATSDGAADCNTNWASRKKITFNNAAASVNLTNFPVLVRLTSSNIDYAKTKAAGEDLRFIDPAAPSTLLDYEIETWNESGESLVWVNVPQIDLGSSSDYIWFYYNNANGAAGSDMVNTWNTNYKGVWHMKGTSGSATIPDSVTTPKDGTKVSGTGDGAPANYASGAVGGSQDFDGVDDNVSIPDSAVFDITAATGVHTWSFWLNPDDFEEWNAPWWQGVSNTHQFSVVAHTTANTVWGPVTAGLAAGTQTAGDVTSIVHTKDNVLTVGSWHHVSITYDGTQTGVARWKIYVNGINQTDTTDSTGIQGSTGDVSPTTVYMGYENVAGENEDGKMDEVRYQNTNSSESWIEAEYLSMNPNFQYAVVEGEQGTTTTTLSQKNYSTGVIYPDLGSGSYNDLDHPFSTAEYTAMAGDDLAYAQISASEVPSASTSAVPMFMFKSNNLRNTNSDKFDAQAVVRSNIAASSTRKVHLQVYKGGSTNNWVTVAENTSAAVDTDITLDPAEISTNASDYFFAESGPNLACSASSANCWTYWRVWQNPAPEDNQILSADYFNITYAAHGPDKVAFSNSTRTLEFGACNGAASVFTMELQAVTTPTNPIATTVVRVTSTSSDYTIYSDDTCSTIVTNGDFTYTTAQNTKSVYIVDRGANGTKTLTGTRQSGDVLTTGTQDYNLLNTNLKIRGGTIIRGGTKLQ